MKLDVREANPLMGRVLHRLCDRGAFLRRKRDHAIKRSGRDSRAGRALRQEQPSCRSSRSALDEFRKKARDAEMKPGDAICLLIHPYGGGEPQKSSSLQLA